MRRAACLAAMIAACGDHGDRLDGPAPPVDGPPHVDAPVELLFDMDVVVRSTGVSVALVGRFDPGCEPPFDVPRENECVEYDDIWDCQPQGAPCAVVLRLMRGGIVLDETQGGWSLNWGSGYASLATDALVEGDELVVSACDDTIRVPLPPPQSVSPLITDVTFDATDILVEWTRDPAPTGSVLHASNGWTLVRCHSPAPGPARMPRRQTTIAQIGTFWLSAVDRVETVETPWGYAYLWGIAPAPSPFPSVWSWSDAVMIPALVDGWWSLPVGPSDLTLETDGLTETLTLGWELSFRTTADGSLRIALQSYLDDELRYEAGETTDTLTVRFPEGECIGTFPHVLPSDDLELSLDGNFSLVLDTGAVALTCPGEPSPTHSVRLALSWDLPAIARPAAVAP